MKNVFFLLLFFTLISCSTPKIPVDLLVVNGKVYTVNEHFETREAFAVKNGNIVAVGSSEDLQKKYEASKMLDVKGNTVVPGLIDAHAHLYNLGVTMQQVDLVGTQSKEEAIARVKKFQDQKKTSFILGRGWDQNDWQNKKFPSKAALDSLFPDIPVALTRIDGHAYWVNSKALELAGITAATTMAGGEVVLGEDGEPTGILIDTPMRLVRNIIPETTNTFSTSALKDAEQTCLALGLTTVNDAGLNKDIIELIDKLQQDNELSIRVYAMVSNTKENLDYYLNQGIIKTDRLHVRSVKVYADGALGSRGATLKEPYTDKENHFGAMITPAQELSALAKRIANANYQMNTHAIGDSANVAVLRAYSKALEGKEDARWKVEHAQVVSIEDFDYFSKNIIPSVQPTHATSDMYWAEERVGAERIKGAYAYKTLLKKAGIIALGTDFPVERVNPMHTFYAAVARKDLQQYPENGFRKQEALTREEALKGMTIWAAYSNFEDHQKGSIEVGKFADFTILDKDILHCPENEIPNIKVLYTYIDGEEVYRAR